MSLKAIFFDNDGVLVSTERLYLESNQMMLAEYGAILSPEEYQQIVMVKGKGTADILSDLGCDPGTILHAQAYRDQCYFKLVDQRDFSISHAEEVISNLSQRYPLYIVSASRRRHFEAIHQKTGFLKYFQKTFCREDYVKQKPAPDGFLKALDFSGYKASEVLAIDDSPRGIKAAHDANIKTIAIPHDLTLGMEFKEADYHLESIKDLPTLIQRLNKH